MRDEQEEAIISPDPGKGHIRFQGPFWVHGLDGATDQKGVELHQGSGDLRAHLSALGVLDRVDQIRMPFKLNPDLLPDRELHTFAGDQALDGILERGDIDERARPRVIVPLGKIDGPDPVGAPDGCREEVGREGDLAPHHHFVRHELGPIAIHIEGIVLVISELVRDLEPEAETVGEIGVRGVDLVASARGLRSRRSDHRLIPEPEGLVVFRDLVRLLPHRHHREHLVRDVARVLERDRDLRQ